MYFIAVSITLFTLIAGVYLLAKVRNENLGIFPKLLTYLILAVALLMLVCQLYRGVGKMKGHEGNRHGFHHEMMMDGDGDHMIIKKEFRKRGKMGKCKSGMGEKACCTMGADGECGDDCMMPCCKDSASKAECKMHKEVEVIIEKEEN